MTYLYKHEFLCGGCRSVIVKETKSAALTEPPLLIHGVRTLHCEEIPLSKCPGRLGFHRTTIVPPREDKLLRLTLQNMKMGTGKPLKVECQAAIDAMWAKGLANGTFSPEMTAPDEHYWMTIQSAQERLNAEAASRRPANAKQALDKAILDGAGRDLRTLAVAFNKTTKDWVTGYSAGSAGWTRTRGSVTHADVTLAPLVAELNRVRKVADLGREVWVCAEVDAAAKALKKGWTLGSLSFAAAEYPGQHWRDIEACAHCAQWCG